VSKRADPIPDMWLCYKNCKWVCIISWCTNYTLMRKLNANFSDTNKLNNGKNYNLWKKVFLKITTFLCIHNIWYVLAKNNSQILRKISTQINYSVHFLTSERHIYRLHFHPYIIKLLYTNIILVFNIYTVTWKPIIRFWQFSVQKFQTQLAIKWPFSFPPHPSFVFALPGEITTSEISLFIQCDVIA